LDLNTISEILMPRAVAEIPAMAAGDAFLAGGTWLFSEPQPGLSRLVDLTRLGWAPLTITPAGLEIAATCTIATLAAFEPPPDWVAGPLIVQCCRALLGSFKIWNMATVGGNICMSLPAGPMTSLCTALEGECVILAPGGDERRMHVKDFVLGPQHNALRAGEFLRRIEIPLAALKRRTGFRQISLSPLGRSGALLIGTLGEAFALTVTAATRRPVRIAFESFPHADELTARLDEEIPHELYYDDVHGRPEWRKHMTYVFAEEIRRELAA
jgi:CO/xanthine dehydrogenase FAD-binding subunit